MVELACGKREGFWGWGWGLLRSWTVDVRTVADQSQPSPKKKSKPPKKPPTPAPNNPPPPTIPKALPTQKYTHPQIYNPIRIDKWLIDRQSGGVSLRELEQVVGEVLDGPVRARAGEFVEAFYQGCHYCFVEVLAHALLLAQHIIIRLNWHYPRPSLEL
jgi:hypothetical protein